MVSLQSPSLGLPTPSSSMSRRSTTTPAVPKLRDSCHACSSSKLKCNKEKPTCSRCAKRGQTCEYVLTKRGGRKRESQSNGNDNHATTALPSAAGTRTTMTETQPLPSLSNWFAPDSTAAGVDALPSPGMVLPSPRPTTLSASSTFFPTLLSSMGQSEASVLTDLPADLDDFSASPISFSVVPDMTETDFLRSRFFSVGEDNGSNSPADPFNPFPASEDTFSEIFNLINPHSPPTSHPSSNSDVQQPQGSHPNSSSCFCLIRALGLMKQLFPGPSAACTTSASPELDRSIPFPTIQAVIAKNERTLEAVSTMLQCPCSQDGYLLAIMSLIIFKVLGWYGAAATGGRTSSASDKDRCAESTSHSRCCSYSEQVLLDPTVVGSYHLNGEDVTRMAAQLVLSELHLAQRLVNQLSAKLKMQGARNSGMANPPISLTSENADSETPFSLSPVMLDQLEVDLRKRLRALSLGFADGLRRE